MRPGRAISDETEENAYRNGLDLNLASPHLCGRVREARGGRGCGGARAGAAGAWGAWGGGEGEGEGGEEEREERRTLRLSSGKRTYGWTSNRKRRGRSSFDAPASHTIATALMPSIRSSLSSALLPPPLPPRAAPDAHRVVRERARSSVVPRPSSRARRSASEHARLSRIKSLLPSPPPRVGPLHARSHRSSGVPRRTVCFFPAPASADLAFSSTAPSRPRPWKRAL